MSTRNPVYDADMMTDETKLVPLDALATLLGVPRTWLSGEARAGRLPCLRIGRRLLFDPRAVRAILADRAAVQQGGADGA